MEVPNNYELAKAIFWETLVDYTETNCKEFERILEGNEFKEFLSNLRHTSLEHFPLLEKMLSDYYKLLFRLGKSEVFLDNYASLTKHFGGKLINLFYPLSTGSIVAHDLLDHCIGEGGGTLLYSADDYPSWRIQNRLSMRQIRRGIKNTKSGISGETITNPFLPKNYLSTLVFPYIRSNPEITPEKIHSSHSIENLRHAMLLRLISQVHNMRYIAGIAKNAKNPPLNEDSPERKIIFDGLNNQEILEGLTPEEISFLTSLIIENKRLLEPAINNIVRILRPRRFQILQQIQSKSSSQ